MSLSLSFTQSLAIDLVILVLSLVLFITLSHFMILLDMIYGFVICDRMIFVYQSVVFHIVLLTVICDTVFSLIIIF